MAIEDKVYVGQQLLVRLDCEDPDRPNVPPLDLSTATTLKIKYLKPGETTPGEFTAAHDAGDVSVMEYTMTSVQTDTAGDWKFWSWADFGAGLILIGEAQLLHFYAEGD